MTASFGLLGGANGVGHFFQKQKSIRKKCRTSFPNKKMSNIFFKSKEEFEPVKL
jgi:hypothetical protein